LKVLMIVVFFASGCLEIISILFRPISLGFRLYGNVFAGETMLETMARLKPGFGWLLPIPFTSWNCWWAWCKRWFSCCCALCSRC
jgi:F0F1-type ATP synthase, subunit a